MKYLKIKKGFNFLLHNQILNLLLIGLFIRLRMKGDKCCYIVLFILIYHFVMIDLAMLIDYIIIRGFEQEKFSLEDVMEYMLDRYFRRLIIKFVHDHDKKFQTDILTRQAEINYLQSQISPHFLYNSLETIRGKAYIDGEMEIADMTEALAAFFRYSISLKGRMITLAEEMDNVKNYFLIQQYRFYNKFSIEYDFDEEEWYFKNSYLPKMILQPLIENAIIHGLEEKRGSGKITIRIQSVDKRLVLNIADDGVGMSEEMVKVLNGNMQNLQKKSSSGGIAVYNVNQRIKLYFGNEYGLYYTSIPDFGTNVEVTLPVVGADAAKVIEGRINET